MVSPDLRILVTSVTLLDLAVALRQPVCSSW
jgi:hypothetical protein